MVARGGRRRPQSYIRAPASPHRRHCIIKCGNELRSRDAWHPADPGPGADNGCKRAHGPAVRWVARQRILAVWATLKTRLVLCHHRFHHLAVDAAHVLGDLLRWEQPPRATSAVTRTRRASALAFFAGAVPMALQQRLQLIPVCRPRRRRQRLPVARPVREARGVGNAFRKPAHSMLRAGALCSAAYRWVRRAGPTPVRREVKAFRMQ